MTTKTGGGGAVASRACSTSLANSPLSEVTTACVVFIWQTFHYWSESPIKWVWSVFIVLISCFWWIIYVGIEKSYVYRLGLSRDDIINSFLLTKTIDMLNNRQLFSLEYVCVNFGVSLTSVLELGVCWRVHGFALHKHGAAVRLSLCKPAVITEQWEGDAGQLYQCKYRRWRPPTSWLWRDDTALIPYP